MKINSKNLLAVLLIAILTLVSCGGVKVPALEGGPDEILATVGEINITNADIQIEYELGMKQTLDSYEAQGTKPAPEELADTASRIIDNSVEQKIHAAKIKVLAAEAGIAVDESFVAAQEALILFQNDVDSIEEFFIDLDKKNGFPEGFMAERFAEDMLINTFYSVKAIEKGAAKPTEEEVTEFYENTRQQYFVKPELADLSVIVINYVNEMAEGGEGISQDEALANADTVIAELASGADFNKLAKKYSDTYSEETKAEFLQFNVNNAFGLNPEEVEKVFALEVEAVSEVLQGTNFVAVVKLNKKSESEELALEEIKGLIENAVLGQNQDNRNFFQQVSDEITSMESVNYYREKLNEKAAAEQAAMQAEMEAAAAEMEAEEAVAE